MLFYVWLLPPMQKQKKPTNRHQNPFKGAKGASDTRLNRRSLLAGHPVSTTSLVSRSSSISEVDFCELDETEDALLEESTAGRNIREQLQRLFFFFFHFPASTNPKIRLCTIGETAIFD